MEDRKRQGLVLSMSVRHNVTLASLEKIAAGLAAPRREQEIVQKQVRDLAVKTPHIDQLVGNLGGGNQQKVVLAKWLAKQFDVLILDEPTIGIDVGSRVELYELINDLAKSGVGILLISSDLPEVLGMSDRILVMREGSLVADLERGEATQELIMQYATGSVDARVERVEDDNLEKNCRAAFWGGSTGIFYWTCLLDGRLLPSCPALSFTLNNIMNLTRQVSISRNPGCGDDHCHHWWRN